MREEPTAVVIQRCLDVLPGDPAAEPLVRDMLERAVDRPPPTVRHFFALAKAPLASRAACSTCETSRNRPAEGH
jgi:hypothetical protein